MQDNNRLADSAPAGRVLTGQDPFWPPIGLRPLRQRLRLPSCISEAQLEVAAHAAAIQAARDLARLRRQLRDQGCQQLPAAAQVGPGRALARCYQRKVEAGIRRVLAERLVLVQEAAAVSAKEKRDESADR